MPSGGENLILLKRARFPGAKWAESHKAQISSQLSSSIWLGRLRESERTFLCNEYIDREHEVTITLVVLLRLFLSMIRDCLSGKRKQCVE